MGDDCKIKDYLKIYKSIEEYKKNMTEYDFIDWNNLKSIYLFIYKKYK